MFHDVTPQMAGLVGNWCSTLLYGIAIVTYFLCMYVLLRRRGDRSASATWFLTGASTLQFALSTVYVTLALRLLIEGFINTQPIPEGAFLYFINPAQKTQVVSKAVYFTNTIVGDCILIWRMYMVWGKNIYVCLLPITTVCACMGTGYFTISKYGHITGDLNPTSIFSILNWMIYTWSLSMATQLFATAMIAGKLWQHARRSPVFRSRYIFIIATIVESGAIFTLATACLLVSAVFKTQSGQILGDIATQVATIIPTLIIIQFEMLRSKTASSLRNGDLTGKKQPLGHQATEFGFSHRRGEPSVEVMVSRLATSDSSSEIKSSV